MLGSIPSALDFFINVIFICSCHSKVSELYYTFKELKNCLFLYDFVLHSGDDSHMLSPDQEIVIQEESHTKPRLLFNYFTIILHEVIVCNAEKCHWIIITNFRRVKY